MHTNVNGNVTDKHRKASYLEEQELLRENGEDSSFFDFLSKLIIFENFLNSVTFLGYPRKPGLKENPTSKHFTRVSLLLAFIWILFDVSPFFSSADIIGSISRCTSNRQNKSNYLPIHFHRIQFVLLVLLQVESIK